MPRTMSKWLLSISKDGDFTISLGKFWQCSVTFAVTKCFLMFRGDFSHFSLCPLLLVLSLVTTKHSLAQHVLFALSLLWWDPFKPSPGWTVPVVSALPHRKDAWEPSSSFWPFTGLSPAALNMWFGSLIQLRDTDTVLLYLPWKSQKKVACRRAHTPSENRGSFEWSVCKGESVSEHLSEQLNLPSTT